ncbi:phosphate ABC transporter permease subunit PstC [Acetobacteraceae bacterium]|nr:phosphate ABC transporter permease subunit PstC [Acetobacteraceae bacterium]
MSTITSRQRKRKWLDRFFNFLFVSSAALTLAALGALVFLIGNGGRQAFADFGPAFLVSNIWNPVTQQYGALAPLWGSIISSLIAICLAFPLSFGASFWIVSILPVKWSRPVAAMIQILAGVPSIIFGMWGFFTIVPFVASIQPYLNHFSQKIPGLSYLIHPLFSGAPFGTGLMTAGIVLAIMIAPFMTAVMVDLMRAIPPMLKESAYGLGAGRWEVMTKVVVPWARNGMISATMLGVGRALGETMAVTFVIGDVVSMGWSLFAPRSTVASLIALQFPESPSGSIRLSALMALGFILLSLSAVTLLLARFCHRREK